MWFTSVVPTVMLSVAILTEWRDGRVAETVTALQCRCINSTPPSVFKSNVGLHPLNSKAVPHMFCYRRLSLVMWHASFAHQLQNIYEIYFCSHIRNGKRRGWRITSWRITKSQPLFLSHFICYTEKISLPLGWERYCSLMYNLKCGEENDQHNHSENQVWNT